jgi:hypothetical protein
MKSNDATIITVGACSSSSSSSSGSDNVRVCCRIQQADRFLRFIETLEQFACEVWMRFSSTRGLYMQTSNPYKATCSCELNLPLWRFSEFSVYSSGEEAAASAMDTNADAAASSDDDDDGAGDDDSGEVSVDYFVSIADMYAMLSKGMRNVKSSSVSITSLTGNRLEFAIMSSATAAAAAAAVADDEITVDAAGDVMSQFILQSASRSDQALVSRFMRSVDPATDGSVRHARIRMDANAMSSIFRCSAVTDSIVHFMVHVPTVQIGCYSHGECGESMERVRGHRVRHIEPPLYLGPRANFGSTVPAEYRQFTPRPEVHVAMYGGGGGAAGIDDDDDPSRQQTIRECYSNRSIKFFCKVIHPTALKNSHMITIYAGHRLPLQMRIDIPPPQALIQSSSTDISASLPLHQMFLRTNIAPWKDEDQSSHFRVQLRQQCPSQQRVECKNNNNDDDDDDDDATPMSDDDDDDDGVLVAV